MRQNERLISVIIPVYNTEKYLSRCLDSILNSTYKNLEVICVNDGSLDGSLAILRKYAEKDERVLIIDKENGGVSSARNIGLGKAKGEYIAFIDSDDWVHQEYFEILTCYQHKTDAHIVDCGHRHVKEEMPDDSFAVNYFEANEKTFAEALSGTAGERECVWRKLYVSKAVEGCLFDETFRLSEDAKFNAIVYMKNPDFKLVHIDAPIYYYYERSDSAVHTVPSSEIIKLGDFYIDRIPRENGATKAALLIEGMKNVFSYRYHEMFNDNKKELQPEIRKRLRICARYLYRTREISLKKKAIFSAMMWFPILYRVWRIKNDPTLLHWEKKQKELRKAKNE